MLPWDSAFFKRRIAIVNGQRETLARLQEATLWAAEHLVDCLYYQVDPQCDYAARDAERAGFSLVDVRLTLERSGLDVASTIYGTRLATADDLPRLRAIASQSHRDTRFYFDEHLRPASDSLYVTWIERSVVEGFADAVLVVDGSDGPVGYVTCRLLGEAGASIGLLGIAAEARGQGTGTQLLTAALGWLGRRGASRVSVVTQARNLAAQRLYQRQGFLASDVKLWYHAWPLSK